MAKIAILYCKRVQDHSCVACAKCHKAILGSKFGVEVALGTHPY